MTTPAYITANDLAAFFSATEMASLAQDGADATALTTSVNAEVHAYLAALIGDSTLLTIPPAVKVKAADIVRFYLYKNSPEDVIVKRWEAANAWLLAVAKGSIPLPLDLQAPVGDSTSGVVWSEPGTAIPAGEWDYL